MLACWLWSPGSLSIPSFGAESSAEFDVVIASWTRGSDGSFSWTPFNTTRLRGSDFPHTIEGILRGFYTFQVNRVTSGGPSTVATIQSNHGFRGEAIHVDVNSMLHMRVHKLMSHCTTCTLYLFQGTQIETNLVFRFISTTVSFMLAKQSSGNSRHKLIFNVYCLVSYR